MQKHQKLCQNLEAVYSQRTSSCVPTLKHTCRWTHTIKKLVPISKELPIQQQWGQIELTEITSLNFSKLYMVILNVYKKTSIHRTTLLIYTLFSEMVAIRYQIRKKNKTWICYMKGQHQKKLPCRHSATKFFHRLHLRINNFNVLYYSNTLRNGYSERDCTFDFLWLWSWGSPLVVLAWAFHGYGYLYCETNEVMLDSSTNCDKAYTV